METVNHECYLSLDVAKLLEEAGFDWESHFTCEQQQDEWQQSAFIEVSNPQYDKSIPFSSPMNIVVLPHVTLDVAQRWLREVKNYEVFVDVKFLANKGYITRVETNIFGYSTDIYRFYEEALEAGIKKVLELILEKGE